MSLARARRGRYQANYWPGFVDMLSTLLLVVTFLMSLFMLSNFVVTQATSGKDTMLSRLNRQLAELTELLALERSKKESVEDNLSALQATLGEKEKENDRLTGLLGSAGGATQGAEERAKALGSSLDQQKKITNDALAKVEMLNQQLAALRLQIASLQEALEASEAKDKDSQAKIADLGQRLNVALAKKVQELARYRSDFFGKLREALGNRADFQIVGDRFVFPSDVLFDSGSDDLEAGGRLAARQARRGAARSRDANPAGHRLGDARRRPYRHQADRHAPISLELGAVERAGDFRGALSDVAGRAGEPAGCRRLRRVPADRPGRQRRGSGQEPPHRAEAHRALAASLFRGVGSELQIGQPLIDAAPRDQALMRSLLDQASMIEHQDAVGADRRSPAGARSPASCGLA